MTSWTSGYVADLPYTHGFYRELTPELLSFAAFATGKTSVRSKDRLTYCELGCGQGFSANILAAANPGADIHATDFNPEQIAGARRLAEEAGLSNAHFYDHAFADFADEPSLPSAFDIIALHGIYSWISAENRRHIVEFIRRKLKVGGLVYISYNALPGWAAAMPLRRLLIDHAGTRSGPIVPRIDEAIAFVETLIKAGAAYFKQNPNLGPRLDKLKGLSRNYLAHEYFNRDWTPFYFADVATELAEAKLSYLGSAHLLDQIDAVNLTAEQQTLLNGISDSVRREGLRDHVVNQQFRRDIFIKGAVAPPVLEARDLWLDQRFALSTAAGDVPLKISTALGEAVLQEEVYRPVTESLSNGPITLRQMVSDQRIANLGWPRLTQALAVLVGSGHLQPCLPAKDDAKRAQRTKAFNAAVIRRAEWSSDLQFLASPVTGGGIHVDRFQQLFLAALAQKGVDPVRHVWSILSGQGQKIVKDGKTLESEEENLAELTARYAEFSEKRLPVLKQLGIT